MALEKQLKYFENAISKNRLSHAYALVGEAGTGRMDFAKEVAKQLGVHPVYDLFVYDSRAGLKVEEARQLQEQIKLKSSSGGYKAAIINDAENMSHSAANSLLKTLEEPPGRSVLFLLTRNFYKLLPTIRSRVQRVSFARKKPEAVEDWERFYEVLEQGTQKQRLLTAEQLAGREGAEIQEFLLYAMKKWVNQGDDPELADKLKQAGNDLNSSLNTKLAIDNLFI